MKAFTRWLFTGSLAKLTGVVGFLVAIPLVLAFMLASLGLPVMGFGWLNPEEEAPPAIAKPTGARVSLNDTPAGLVMDRTFRSLDKEWQASSAIINAAGLPHPMSCVSPAAALSDSKSYTIDGQEAQVTMAAWPAGIGGEMYSRFVNDVITCKPSETSVYTYSVSDLGVEASTIEVQWSVNDIETTFFRRGDMIVFVATADGQGSEVKARTVDQVVASLMSAKVCPEPALGLDAQVRNAFFSGDRFTGLVRRTRVESEKAPRPKLTPKLANRGVKALKGRGKDINVEPVTLPSDDFAYPLWPELPTPAEIPSAPSTPPKQKLEDFTGLRIPDPVGPGCGWAFLSTVEAAYDEEQVDSINDAQLSAVQEALDADGPRWQRAVLRYWSDYHAYRQSIQSYEDYRAEVQAVGEAWDLIHQAWDQYYTDYANWEVKNQARLTFIANQEAAADEFQAQKDECKAFPDRQEQYQTDYAQYEADQRQYDIVDYPQYEQDLADYNANYDVLYAQYKADLKEWRENGKQGEKPQPPQPPTPPTQPQPPVEPTLDHPCPPVRPAILDEKPPTVPPAPQPPADPRPVGERD